MQVVPRCSVAKFLLGNADHDTVLGAVLRLHRAIEVAGGPAKKPGAPPAVCGCARKIRLAKTVLAADPIVCGGLRCRVRSRDPWGR